MLLRVIHVSMAAPNSAASSSSALQPTGAASSSSALQPTERVITSASSSSGASQLTEQALAPRLDLTEVWARIHTFGRFPKKLRCPESAAQHEEDSLYYFLYNAKKLGIPDDVWSEMRNYGASQVVESQGEKLINEVKALGYYPSNQCNSIETQP